MTLHGLKVELNCCSNIIVFTNILYTCLFIYCSTNSRIYV